MPRSSPAPRSTRPSIAVINPRHSNGGLKRRLKISGLQLNFQNKSLTGIGWTTSVSRSRLSFGTFRRLATSEDLCFANYHHHCASTRKLFRPRSIRWEISMKVQLWLRHDTGVGHVKKQSCWSNDLLSTGYWQTQTWYGRHPLFLASPAIFACMASPRSTIRATVQRIYFLSCRSSPLPVGASLTIRPPAPPSKMLSRWRKTSTGCRSDGVAFRPVELAWTAENGRRSAPARLQARASTKADEVTTCAIVFVLVKAVAADHSRNY